MVSSIDIKNSVDNKPIIHRVASVSAIGTAVEYYDFSAYGTVAVFSFGHLFFPSDGPLISALIAFVTYVVGFPVRPLGGIVFGHIDDKVGRKKALVVTILIVGLGTFCIGLLPTYEKIGVWAPALLIFIRVLRGFSVGGEQAGAVLMTAEYSEPKHRGLLSSWVQIGAPVGFLLPLALFALLNATLSPETMIDYGWRIPLLLSLLLIIVGLFIRLKIDESPVFAQIREIKAEESRPLVEAIRNFSGIVTKGICVKLIEAYTFAMFTVTVLACGKANDLDANILMETMIVAVIVETIAMPLMGLLCDKIGRKPVYTIGALLQVVMIIPLFFAINQDSFWLTQIVMILTLSVGHSTCYAPQASYFPEPFPTHIRYSGTALIWQLGSLIGSGILGLVAVKILQITDGHYYGLVTYVIVLGVISIIGLLMMPETALQRLKRKYQQ